MSDIRFVAARKVLWDKKAWQQPARLAFIIRTLKEIVDDEAEPTEFKTEAEVLIKKLHLAAKEPPLAER